MSELFGCTRASRSQPGRPLKRFRVFHHRYPEVIERRLFSALSSGEYRWSGRSMNARSLSSATSHALFCTGQGTQELSGWASLYSRLIRPFTYPVTYSKLPPSEIGPKLFSRKATLRRVKRHSKYPGSERAWRHEILQNKIPAVTEEANQGPIQKKQAEHGPRYTRSTIGSIVLSC